jgi:very-short-patch-repair endonuclease
MNKFFKLGIMIDPRNAFLKEIAAESLKENVLAILGWKIIRFYKDEIDEDIDSCVSEIYQDLVYSFLDYDLTYSNTV